MSSTWSSSMFIYVFDWFVLFYHMLIEKARKLFYLLSMEKINESVDRFLIKFQETMTFYQIERSWLENIKYSLLRRGERENKYNQSFSLSLVWLECWCAFVWRFPFRCVCVCVYGFYSNVEIKKKEFSACQELKLCTLFINVFLSLFSNRSEETTFSSNNVLNVSLGQHWN